MQKRRYKVYYLTVLNSVIIIYFLSPWPEIDTEILSEGNYEIIFYTLAMAHNLMSLFVLISYFLSNHPSRPRIDRMSAFFK